MAVDPVRLRGLARASLLYARADLDWRRAAATARAVFPAVDRPGHAPIGDPNSRVRQLWEARERALARMLALRAAIERARARQARSASPRILLLLPPH